MTTTSFTTCHPELETAWRRVVSRFSLATQGRDLIVTCTYRTLDAQRHLYAQGRTEPGQIVTQNDGATTLSNHNKMPCRALDFAVLIHGKVSWDVREYAAVGLLAQREGLVWGGAWPHFKDNPHLELPKELT